MRRTALAGIALAIIVTVSLPVARGQELTPIEVHSNFYAPAEIRVAAGDTVRWTIVEGTHSVTANDASFDSSPSCAGIQDPLLTGCMTAGDTFEHRFASAGTVTYQCRVHGDAMRGTIVVDATSSASSTSTTSTSTSTSTTQTTTSVTSTTLTSDQSTLAQAPPPEIPGNPRVVPKSIIRSKGGDDHRLLILLAIAIAGITTVVGIVLVRRGRVPIG
jgi:plastocyanin